MIRIRSLMLQRNANRIFSTIAKKSVLQREESLRSIFKGYVASMDDNKEKEKNKKNKIDDGGSNKDNAKLDSTGLKRLLYIIKPEIKTLSLAMATLGGTTAISLVFPTAIGKILDLAVTNDATLSHSSLSTILLGLFVFQSGLIVVRSALLSIAGERLSAGIRRDLFKFILSQEIAWYDQQRTGDIINRLSADTTVLQKALTTNLSNGLRSIFMTAGGVSMLFYINVNLAALSLALIPPVALAGMSYGRYVRDQQKDVQKALGETMEVAEELISAVRTVRLMARESESANKFDKLVDVTYIKGRRIGIASAVFDGAVHAAANVSVVAVLYYGGSLVSTNAISPGDLTAFLMYSLVTGFNISNISSVYTELKRASGAASRIFDIVDREPKIPLSSLPPSQYWNNVDESSRSNSRMGNVLTDWSSKNSKEEKKLLTFENQAIKGDISFQNIVFKYPTREDVEILKDFNLTIQSGTHIAIVGSSGSGKSTIGSLLTRLYDVQQGAITVDGINIKDVDPRFLRSSISVVSQEPTLFATTILENIQYGNSSASLLEVENAAIIANAHDFIKKFPEGYNTLVGERGIQLSGGQKQRCVIARAVLKNSKIWILDEATSSLDSESESIVNSNLTKIFKDRTVITIAHRLSTMRAADLVAVIDKGSIVETGPFDSLYNNKDSIFRKLIDKQLIARV